MVRSLKPIKKTMNHHLLRNGLFDNTLSSILRKANGLRNRLVHGYNTLSDEVALESIKILLPEIKKMRRFIETWI
jgi:uncharacterized protein YutE (UPF0331/DUF86 family)